jgi:hypothetical protein
VRTTVFMSASETEADFPPSIAVMPL